MLKSRCALLFLLFPCAAAAQYPGDEYYPYAEREERRELLTTDSTIFYRAVQSPSDLYGLRTGFNLPQVALRRRGLDYTLERTSLMGVAVSYRYLAALRLLGAEEQRYAGLAAAPGEPAAAGGMRAFRFSDGEPLQPFLASVRFTDRNYLVGAKAAYAVPLSASTSFAATLAAEAGVAKYSMLDWYDARTPMPDNYRYLPSYTGDRETEQAWLARDPRYTQIDWDELIRQNRMAGGHAVYALEDRVERLCNLAFDASFATEADARLTLRYGVSLRRENTRSYKQMRDLLGAGYVTDIDRFLIDDDTYSNLLQNDLRHPGRTVREGDRFGYDYALTLRGAALRLQADYRSDRFRADLSVVLGSDAVSRRGYYEKELFPGGQSYGPSRVMRFTPYTLKVAAGWAFTPRRYIEIAAAAAARTPRAGDLFFQPLYNNRTVDNPVPERIYAAELNCRLTGPVVDFQAAFFAAMTLDGIETRTYYDDMASVYCDMAVTGVGRMSCGAEAAADIRLSYRWLLSLAASAGCYEYIRDPRVTVLSDVDNSAVDVQAVSRMGGCETGGAPQLTALAEIAWFGPKGWGCRASAGYAGRRYVEPMPLRRTDRIAGQGGITREFFDAFTRQERLPDAFTLDAALFKSFRFERSRLTASLMLRNLTGEADTVYGGYESLRVRRIRPGDDMLYAPHASRCTYAWPRSFYLTISYRF